MTTLRLNRVCACCEYCNKQFIAVERSNKKLQKYCSAECQRQANEPNDSPDENEIRRRASIIRSIRESGIVQITQDMLDWY